MCVVVLVVNCPLRSWQGWRPCAPEGGRGWAGPGPAAPAGPLVPSLRPLLASVLHSRAGPLRAGFSGVGCQGRRAGQCPCVTSRGWLETLSCPETLDQCPKYQIQSVTKLPFRGGLCPDHRSALLGPGGAGAGGYAAPSSRAGPAGPCPQHLLVGLGSLRMGHVSPLAKAAATPRRAQPVCKNRVQLHGTHRPCPALSCDWNPTEVGVPRACAPLGTRLG